LYEAATEVVVLTKMNLKW